MRKPRAWDFGPRRAGPSPLCLPDRASRRSRSREPNLCLRARTRRPCFSPITRSWTCRGIAPSWPRGKQSKHCRRSRPRRWARYSQNCRPETSRHAALALSARPSETLLRSEVRTFGRTPRKACCFARFSKPASRRTICVAWPFRNVKSRVSRSLDSGCRPALFTSVWPNSATNWAGHGERTRRHRQRRRGSLYMQRRRPNPSLVADVPHARFRLRAEGRRAGRRPHSRPPVGLKR